MNNYRKFYPNVFVAECDQKHEQGEEIILTTKRGKENKHIVFNFVGYSGTKENPKFCYSIVRADGMTHQDFKRRKAERIQGFKANAEKRSQEAYEGRATQAERDFLSLGEPIKVGHHSEKRHRKLFEKYDNKMRKSVEEAEKAEEYKARAEYWEARANEINLSMPESLEFFTHKLEEAKANHKFLKDNPDKRAHSYSLTYAKKAVNETEKKLKIAVRLWGDKEAVNEIETEAKSKAEAKAEKQKKCDDLIKKYGGFFAFNNEQLKEGYNKILESGHVKKGEKVKHLAHGLYLPSKNVSDYLNSL